MNTWIFQGNPKKFKIDEYLANNKIVLWTIRQKHYTEEISIDDIVYIWRADGGLPLSGGIIACGKIISLPEEMEEDFPELWTDSDGGHQKDVRVKIEIEDLRLNKTLGMLKRVEIEQNPQLCDLRILRFRSHTNYKIDTKHARWLKKLWEQMKKRS